MSRTEADLTVYKIYYDITESFVNSCDAKYKNKENTEYWGCIESAYIFGLGFEDAQGAARRLGAGDYDKVISLIRLRKSIWAAYEAGELSYEMAKLRDSEVEFSIQSR